MGWVWAWGRASCLDGNSKGAIRRFVEQASGRDPWGDGAIPVSERIVVFDNDGTLSSEQPLDIPLLVASSSGQPYTAMVY